MAVYTLPIEFDSAQRGGGPPPGEVHEDMTFEVARQYGRRRIVVSVESPAWAVKKITLDDIDVTDTPVDLRTKDVVGIEIVLTSKVSGVSGGVSDDKGRPVTDYTALVFPSDPTKWTDRSRFVSKARPTQQGRFTITALPPEDYRAIALPTISETEWMDPEFLQLLRAQATAFTLGEGDRKSLELRLKRRP